MIAFGPEKQPTRADSERERVRRTLAAKRAGERDVIIPACANPERRTACEADICLALRTYFPEIFYDPFTDEQKAMIEDVLYRMKHGGWQAIAAHRGGGKTMITTYVLLLAMLFGWVKFPFIVAATGPKATRILRNVKVALRHNDTLAEDFPEVCTLVRYVASAPQRAQSVTINGGIPVDMVWRDDHIILPTVEGSKASGAIFSTAGITGDDIRGININGVRPDYVLLDDVDTRESAASIEQTEKRELTIEQDIAGLGGPGKKFGGTMLCTILNRQCLAYMYTDRKMKPGWNGRRYKLMVEPPAHAEMWEEYVQMRLHGQQMGTDPEGREAHNFYLTNRAKMEEGAVISNPYRYNANPLPDGSETESSALEACYIVIAKACKEGKDGWNHFATEYQNDPPPLDGLENSGITSSLVTSRISGLELQELPHEFKSLVHFIDLGHHYCYWGDCAWQPECIGTISDYGALDVHGVTKDSDQAALERALLKTLHEWRSMLLGKYKDHEGNVINPSLCLVDSGSGLHTRAVYQFCKEAGHPFYPSKGFDKAAWRAPAKSSKTGDHWAKVPQPGGAQLYEFDATYWKQFAHQRFLTPTFDAEHRPKAGSLSLFICPELEQYRKERREFTHQAVAEIWGTAKPGAKPGWIGHKKNHYQDVTAGLCLAASVTGIELIPTSRPMKPRVPLNQMARKSA